MSYEASSGWSIDASTETYNEGYYMPYVFVLGHLTDATNPPTTVLFRFTHGTCEGLLAADPPPVHPDVGWLVMGGSRLTIRLPEQPSAGAVQAYVYDVAGRLITSRKGQLDGTDRVVFEDLPTGVYFARATAGGTTFSGRALVVR